MNKLRAVLLLAGFVLSTAVIIPVQYLAIRSSRAMARRVPLYYLRWLCAWLGIRIKVNGQPARANGMLFLANHTSYFDILALSTAAEVSFIAKSEVAAWPFFGLLAQLQRTVFVDRERRAKTKVSRDEMAQRLTGGDNLVLFPEGTSNDGNRVLSFKSALIGVVQEAVKAELKFEAKSRRHVAAAFSGGANPTESAPGTNSPITIQPVSIIYRRVHGVPMGRQYRPFFAWYGDMELLPHLFEAICLGPVDVEITFHDQIPPEHAMDRKAVAQHCQLVIGQAVAGGLSTAGLRGPMPVLDPLASPIPRRARPVSVAPVSGKRPDSGENPAPAF